MERCYTLEYNSLRKSVTVKKRKKIELYLEGAWDSGRVVTFCKIKEFA